MDKMAELIRDAEIRGAMAAFIDAGLIKVANDEEAEALIGKVCEKIGEEKYDLQKVASVTDEILSGMAADGQPKEAPQEKSAEEKEEFARNAALGELLQMKIAGQIDDATFKKTAADIIDMNREPDGKYRAGGIKPVANIQKINPKKNIPWKSIGVGTGTLASAGALGALLYNKYRKRDQ